MTILCSDYARISLDILGLWSNRLSIGGSTSGIFRANRDLQDFVAGAVIGEVGGWLDCLRALEMTFHMWRRPLMTLILCGRCSILVRLEGDLTCSTHWKWRFQSDADHGRHSFCVAGALFGEVGGWLFVTGAALRDILGDSNGTRHVVFYNTKSSPSWDE